MLGTNFLRLPLQKARSFYVFISTELATGASSGDPDFEELGTTFEPHRISSEDEGLDGGGGQILEYLPGRLATGREGVAQDPPLARAERAANPSRLLAIKRKLTAALRKFKQRYGLS